MDQVSTTQWLWDLDVHGDGRDEEEMMEEMKTAMKTTMATMIDASIKTPMVMVMKTESKKLSMKAMKTPVEYM